LSEEKKVRIFGREVSRRFFLCLLIIVSIIVIAVIVLIVPPLIKPPYP